MRTHYVSTKDAYTVITRAMDIIQRTGRTVAIGESAEPEPARDLLTDVGAVLDSEDKLRSSEVLYQLRTRWESAYGGWSAQQFATSLEEYGVKIKKRSLEGQPGQRVILTADVIAALSQRPKSGQIANGPT